MGAQEVGGRKALKGGFKRPARATPGARYARRPLKGPRRPFGTRFEPPTAESFVRKRGAKLAPLENPPTAHVQPAASRRLVPLHPTILLSDGSPGTPGGKQRPERAFARAARVRGEAAQFSASAWALRATQKRPCLPRRTSGTVPETLGQRHCARGAAADGMPYTRPLIHGRGAADFGRRPTGGGVGVAGAKPLVPFFGSFLGQARKELAVGRLPTSSAAH